MHLRGFPLAEVVFLDSFIQVYIHAKGCHSSPQIPETEKPKFASSNLKTQLCKFSYVFSFTQQSFGRSLCADLNISTFLSTIKQLQFLHLNADMFLHSSQSSPCFRFLCAVDYHIVSSTPTPPKVQICLTKQGSHCKMV